jgi:hypothetical protein
VKIKHKVNIPWDYVPPSHIETDDRYLAELETARRKAEKAWRKAQQDLARAERRLAAKPDPELKAAKEAALREFEARERELREIEALMRGPEGGQARVVQRAGRDNRLEIGEYRPPKRKKGKPQPVRVTRSAPNPPCKTCRGKPPRGFTCSTCGATTDAGTVRS